MKRSSITSKKRGGGESKGYKYDAEVSNNIDWELRPGGMLVQKRSFGSDSAGCFDPNLGGPMIKIKVSHGSYHHDVSVPAQSTFGDLKRVLACEMGLEPKEQRLLFRGKEKDDEEYLHMAGVANMSKVVLLEDPASKERKLEEMKRNQQALKAHEAVASIRADINKLSQKVVGLGKAVDSGARVPDKEFVVLTELLMVQLLKLDAIEADGEAKVQRRIEVRRVQSFVDALDKLKMRNSNPFSNGSRTLSVSTKWEAFDFGVGSLSAPGSFQSCTRVTQDWEMFD